MRIEINEKTGAVTINGKLCAELPIGLDQTPLSRDDLEAELGDRRALKALKSKIIRETEAFILGALKDHNFRTDRTADVAFAQGLRDGLEDVTISHPMTGQPILPDYSKAGRSGFELGSALVRIRDMLRGHDGS